MELVVIFLGALLQWSQESANPVVAKVTFTDWLQDLALMAGPKKQKRFFQVR